MKKSRRLPQLDRCTDGCDITSLSVELGREATAVADAVRFCCIFCHGATLCSVFSVTEDVRLCAVATSPFTLRERVPVFRLLSEQVKPPV